MVPLAVCFTTIAASIVGVTLFGKNGASGNLIWVSNGLLLAYLLLAPRWRWPAYLGAGFAGLVVGSWLVHETWSTNLFFNSLDMIEILFGASLLRGKATQLPRFTQGRYLVRFFAFAVLAGPTLAVAIGTVVRVALWHGAPVVDLVEWLTSDSLGTAVSCPIIVAMLAGRRNQTRRWRHNGIYLVILVAITLGVFTRTNAPTMFLIYPALIVVVLRMGLGWAAFSSLFVAFTGGWCTIHGSGPLAAASLSMANRGLILQIFVAAGVFMIYSVSVVLESRSSVERRLARIVSLHDLVTENSRDAIILSDFHGNRTYVSAAVQRILGWRPDEFAKMRAVDLVYPDDLPPIRKIIAGLRTGGNGATFECRMRKDNGKYRWVESSVRIVRHPRSGLPSAMLIIVRDITMRRAADEARIFQNSVLRAIHEVALEGILVVNSDGNVVSYNRSFTSIWRLESLGLAEALDGQSTALPDKHILPAVAASVKDSGIFLSRVRELYADPEATDQCELQLKDGRTIERYSASVKGEGGEYLGRVWFFRDVSAAKLSQKRLEAAYRTVEALASTDSLTGLANRRRFDQVLSTEWRRGLRDHSPLSLLMIDVDLFKLFNDNYGHPKGDSCLRQVAEAAQDIIARPGDLVARFGGEEFAVILPSTGREGAMRLAEEICEAMRMRQLAHPGNPFGIVTVSVGCATMVPAFGIHAVNLVEAADRALYTAKDRGRNQACGEYAMEDASLAPTGTA